MNPKTFLVAEDDAGVRTLLVALLRHLGIHSVPVENGAQAIDCLRRTSFDGVILDIMMPALNGFEVLEYIRAERPHLQQRTIVVTAASEKTYRYFDTSRIHLLIRKPFEIDELLEAIRKIATSAEDGDGMQQQKVRALPRSAADGDT